MNKHPKTLITDHLPCTRRCPRYWGFSSEQESLRVQGAYTGLGECMKHCSVMVLSRHSAWVQALAYLFLGCVRCWATSLISPGISSLIYNIGIIVDLTLFKVFVKPERIDAGRTLCNSPWWAVFSAGLTCQIQCCLLGEASLATLFTTALTSQDSLSLLPFCFPLYHLSYMMC